MQIKRVVAKLAGAALIVAGAVSLGSGTASAAVPIQWDHFTGVALNHEETVVASQVHVGALIDAVYGDNWTAALPGTAASTTVTGDQFFAEAASHADGTVSFVVTDPSKEQNHNPFWVGSFWNQ